MSRYHNSDLSIASQQQRDGRRSVQGLRIDWKERSEQHLYDTTGQFLLENAFPSWFLENVVQLIRENGYQKSFNPSRFRLFPTISDSTKPSMKGFGFLRVSFEIFWTQICDIFSVQKGDRFTRSALRRSEVVPSVPIRAIFSVYDGVELVYKGFWNRTSQFRDLVNTNLLHGCDTFIQFR